MKKKLQVFISSTFKDLVDERQAAVQAVLDAGHIPAGMELFKAGSRTPLETIYKWIDVSDVYMLILGGRYGSFEKESQKSYTQLEYEYAISKGIPVFAVVLKDSSLKKKSEQLGYESVYEVNSGNSFIKFKDIIMSKIVREVEDPKDIKMAILTTLNEFLEEYDMIGWVRSSDYETNVSLLAKNNALSLKIDSLLEEVKDINQKLSNLQFEFEKNKSVIDAPIDLTKTFENRTVSIQSLANNKYLGADKDQDDTPIFAHRDIRGNWELFKVEITQDGWAAFKACNNGKYISARADKSGTPLFACADTAHAWEYFKIFLHNGNYLLKARVNNKYIMADIKCTITPRVVGLYAYVYKAQEWEQFQIEIVE